MRRETDRQTEQDHPSSLFLIRMNLSSALSVGEHLVEEFSLRELNPELIRLSIGSILEHTLSEAQAEFLSHLLEIGAELILLLPVLWGGEITTKCESTLSGDLELLLGKLIQLFVGITFVQAFGGDCQSLVCIERQIDEHSISGALDLKVAEEHIGLEKIECLVDDVLLGVILLDWSGTLQFCLDGQECTSAHLWHLLCVEG